METPVLPDPLSHLRHLSRRGVNGNVKLPIVPLYEQCHLSRRGVNGNKLTILQS